MAGVGLGWEGVQESSHFRQIQTNGWRVAIATADSQLAEVEEERRVRLGARGGVFTFSLRSANGLNC